MGRKIHSVNYWRHLGQEPQLNTPGNLQFLEKAFFFRRGALKLFHVHLQIRSHFVERVGQ